MKLDRQLLLASWRSRFTGDKTRVGPLWLQLAWTAVFCAAIALPSTVVSFVAFGRNVGDWHRLDVWVAWYRSNLVIALCIGFSIDALFAISRRWLDGSHRSRERAPWQRTLLSCGVPMLGVLLGWPAGMMLAGFDLFRWIGIPGGMNMIAGSLLLALLLSALLSLIFSTKAGQLQAEKRATEARLRLLQGQIEPHFLFNTLANVQALMDHEPAQARQMLHDFTEYLRCSLAALRSDEGPLSQELDLAESYLRLLGARMDERLRWTISADAATRAVPVPPLLLQPLVENAIHHGLEPQLEGGSVHVSARLEGRLLVLEVHDDGRGPDAPSRPGVRKGNGLALQNIRGRLRTRYGPAASLDVQAAHPGTRAIIRLPVEAAAG